MKFHCYSAPQIDTRGLVIKLEYFTILILALFGFIDTFTGGWVGGQSKIKIKDHLSPVEAEIRAELGNNYTKMNSLSKPLSVGSHK